MTFIIFFQRLTFPTITYQRLRPIYNPVEYLQWSFLAKILFAKFTRKNLCRSLFPTNICWSWRRLQDISWKRLQHVFSVTILRLTRSLEDVLEDKKMLRWRCFQELLKTCLEDVLKTCLEDALKICLEDVWKTLWRQTKYLLRILYLTNLNV